MILAGDATGALHVWATAKGSDAACKYLGAPAAHEGTLYSLCVHDATSVFSGGADGKMCAWKLADGALPARCAETTADSTLPLLAVASQKDALSAIFSGGADGRVRQWTLSLIHI